MSIITPENKKVDRKGWGTEFRVIVTNTSGEVVLVSKVYATEAGAIRRLEKETEQPQQPALFGTLLEYAL